MELPLFPLHAMLCPGVTLPLHVFEPRYRALVACCRERREPFRVVLILAGREVGEPPGRLAAVGTTAPIRQTGRRPDGRIELLMAATCRLVTPDDPTALSYVLASLLQVELPFRQALLEAADTRTRLEGPNALLGREIALLGRQVKPLIVDPRPSAGRRN